MNRAVMRKTFRDSVALLVLLALGAVLLEFAIVRVIIEALADLEQLRTWLARPIIQTILRVALGADLIGDLTPTTMATFGLGHPLLYALSWALLLTIGTGVIAGEVDRGTADLLLTLPISRASVYASTSVVWVTAAVVMSAAPLAGLWIGGPVWQLAPPLDFARLWPVTVNLLAVNLAIGGVTMCVSSLVSRRGQAVGIVLALLLCSDLVNLLEQFWSAIRPFSIVGLHHYYRPLAIVRSGGVPWHDVAVLGGVGLVAWLIGLAYFARRDIRAV